MAPSPSISAAAATQLTGVPNSGVQVKDACTATTADGARCLAATLEYTSNKRLVRVQPGSGAAMRIVHRSGVHALVAPASVPAAVNPPAQGTPGWLQQAYDMTALSQNGGTGKTIAIVDAFGDPTAEADLTTYRSTYGLPACTSANGCLTIVNQAGQTSLPTQTDPNWTMEISLDLDTVSAACPNCHILLVEVDPTVVKGMEIAQQTAARMGANVISNSWGGTSPSYASYYSYPGVAEVAATGDWGYNAPGADSYPAAFPLVNAAGGTHVWGGQPSSVSGYTETVWGPGPNLQTGTSAAGSGCATVQPKPAWQKDTGCTGRAYADLSADADPRTGLRVYDSAASGWLVVGGTSLASPIIASFVALTGVNATTPQWAYQDAGLLTNVTQGNNMVTQGLSCAPLISYICTAGPGYNGPTGVGSVVGDVVSGPPGIGGPGYSFSGQQGWVWTYASGWNATSAKLSFGVYPNGLDTTYVIQYGTSTGYGQQTAPVDVGSSAAPVAVTPTLSGLTRGTIYHYRVVATNSAGTTYGYDYTFDTTFIAPLSTVAPVASGNAAQGQTLSATHGSWYPGGSTTYTYQWQRQASGSSSWTNISGATSSTYTLTSADGGANVQVLVTASAPYGGGAANNGPSSTSAASNAIGPVVGNGPVNSGLPTIGGSATRGSTLTSTTGTWSGSPTFAYQWQSAPTGSTNWSNISGATNPSYVPSQSDEGNILRIVITASNTSGSTSAASAASATVAGAPPVNSALPVVSGSVAVGSALSANTGTWTGAGNSFAYQWQRCNASGQSCTAISDATSASYTVAGGDAGSTLEVVVTASNVDGHASAISIPTSVVPQPSPPVNTSVPAVSGNMIRGSALVASTGTWNLSSGLSFAYQWQHASAGKTNWSNISGATNSTYILSQADEGTILKVTVTATNNVGSTSATSAVTGTIVAAPPVNSTPPTISGTVQQGQVLSASTGTWGGVSNTYAYQWQRCNASGQSCTAISGAKNSSYTLVSGDVGSTVRVAVITSNLDASATAPSAVTAVVVPLAPSDSVAPWITGTAQRTATLTGSAGTWSGAKSYAYQWERCTSGGCVAIAGATTATYVVSAADEGANLAFLVTATNAGGSTMVSSAGTAAVAGYPMKNIHAPVISGSAKQGATLTVSGATWSGPAGATLGYQWEQCDSTGGNCAPINGATATTYSVTTTNVGHRLAVLATATNVDGTTNAASAPTAVVIPVAPVNVTKPAVSGSGVHVGSAVSATRGGWGPSVVSSDTLQWMRCTTKCTAISGATGSTYTVSKADVGAVLEVSETAVNAGGSTTVVSNGVGPVTSASTGTAVVTSKALTVNGTTGVPLARAQIVSGAATAAAASTPRSRSITLVRISKAGGITGTLHAWACRAGSTALNGAPCSRAVVVTGSATLRLTAGGGAVRVVVMSGR